MRKRQKKVQEFQSALKVGDRVITTGGIYGQVTKCDEKTGPSPDRGQGPHRVPRAAIGGYQGQEPVVQPDGASACSSCTRISAGSSSSSRPSPALAVWSFTPPSRRSSSGSTSRAACIWFSRSRPTMRSGRDRDGGRADAEALKTAEGHRDGRPVDQPDEFVVEGVPPASDQQFRQWRDEQRRAGFDREPGAGRSYTFRMKPNIAVQRRARRRDAGAFRRSSGASTSSVSPSRSSPRTARPATRSSCSCRALPTSRGPRTSSATRPARDQAGRGRPAPDRGDAPQRPWRSGAAGHGGRARHRRRSRRPVTDVLPRETRPGDHRPGPAQRPAVVDEFDQPAVGFTLNNEGVSKFTRVTGRTSAGSSRSCSTTRCGRRRRSSERIAQAEARITGAFTQQEAQDLALILRSGALPASLDDLEQRAVGPSLGADSIRAGIMASLIGLGVRHALHADLLPAGRHQRVRVGRAEPDHPARLHGYLGAVMTLPGIAGFILTIGMGVDSNVLIFERIREELAAKKGARQAIAAGFDRVFLHDSRHARRVAHLGGVPVPVRHRADPRIRDDAVLRPDRQRVHRRVRLADALRVDSLEEAGRRAQLSI